LSDTLPPYPGRPVGYAGGIGPDNVVDIIKRINAAGPYWIDMESKIRTDNWLDLKLCRAVCEAVYGEGMTSLSHVPQTHVR
jgi:phosphoribosylanthranilate isomerase